VVFPESPFPAFSFSFFAIESHYLQVVFFVDYTVWSLALAFLQKPLSWGCHFIVE
jgi:hypothetical protein